MWWLACAPDPVAPTADQALPSAWEHDAHVDDEPLDAETIQAVLDELIRVVDDYPASELFPGYASAVEERSDSCVDWAEATEDGLTYVNWSGRREACDDPESGIFYGQVHHFEGDDFPGGIMSPTPTQLPEAGEDASDWVLGGTWLVGQGDVLTPDGVRLALAGRFASLRAHRPGHRIWFNQVEGSWVYDGVPAVDWMGPSQTVDWTVRAEQIGDWQQRSVRGAIDVLPSTAGTVYTEGLVVNDDCPLEPVGSVLVRGPDGRWAEVVFEGECDGCGSSGQDAICVDASPWVGWEDQPW